MTTLRQQAVRVSLLALGDGQVIRDRPPESIIPQGQLRVLPSPAETTTNLRLLNGVATTRPGLTRKTTAAKPNSNRITGLFQTLWNDARTDSTLIRCTASTVHRFHTFASGNLSDNYADITPSTVPAATEDNYWTFAMGPGIPTPQAGASNYLYLSSGNDADPVWYWDGANTEILPLSGTSAPKGSRTLVAYLNRLFHFNYQDSATSNRLEPGIRWSVSGDPADYTGIGAGAAILGDSPHPVSSACVIAGRLIVFQGDAHGGAIYVGTPTGNTFSPVRYDVLSSRTRAGLLCPRTLLCLNPNLAFFVGHDGFYLFDGARSLNPIMTTVTRHILARINRDHLEDAHAWYKPRTNEIHVALPMDANTLPSEVWVYNLREQRTFGPYEYNPDLTTSSQASLVDDAGPSWDDVVGDWADTPAEPQDSAWDSLASGQQAITIVFGSDDGEIYQDDETATTDDGTAIPITYESPAILPDDLTHPLGPQQQRILVPEDLLTLLDFTMRFRDDGQWTPTVEVTRDNGTTYTTISDGAAVGTVGANGQILSKTYFTSLTGGWIQDRITSTGKVTLYSLLKEFQYAGSARSD